MPAPWTPERTEALIKLRNDGLTASQIANELGHTSRNACIGKLYRLGLSVIGCEAPKAMNRTRPAKRKAKMLCKVFPAPVIAPEPLPPMPEEQGSVRFIDATRRQCAYITNSDAPIDERMVCGAGVQPGSPYCSRHHKVCYTKAEPKRRKRFVNTGWGRDQTPRSPR